MLEGLVEGVILVAVEREHLGIGRKPGQRRVEGPLRNPLSGGFLGEILEPSVEIAAARGGECRAGRQRAKEAERASRDGPSQ